MHAYLLRRPILPALGLLLGFCLAAARADESTETGKDTDSKRKTEKSDNDDKDKDEAQDVERGRIGQPVDTGLRERWGYKQRRAAAIQRYLDRKEQQRKDWEADEERRREAIRKTLAKLAERRKKAAGNVKDGSESALKTTSAPPSKFPPHKVTTIKVQNGSTFEGIILGETEQDITLTIEGGELTIDKRLIKQIRRPRTSSPSSSPSPSRKPTPSASPSAPPKVDIPAAAAP